ncbi:VOC family protein [Thalassotalea fusca]
MKNPATLLVVSNLQASKKFYLDVLNFELVEEFTHSLKMKLGNHTFIIFQGSKDAADYEHGYNASSTVVFPVENIDEAINRLSANKVEFIHSSPNQNQWGRYIAFKDPSGIVFEVMEWFA